MYAIAILPAVDLMVNPSFYVDAMLSGVMSSRVDSFLRGALKFIVQIWGFLTAFFALRTVLTDIQSWTAFAAYVFLTGLWFVLWQDPSALPRFVDRAYRSIKDAGI